MWTLTQIHGTTRQSPVASRITSGSYDQYLSALKETFLELFIATTLATSFQYLLCICNIMITVFNIIPLGAFLSLSWPTDFIKISSWQSVSVHHMLMMSTPVVLLMMSTPVSVHHMLMMSPISKLFCIYSSQSLMIKTTECELSMPLSINCLTRTKRCWIFWSSICWSKFIYNSKFVIHRRYRSKYQTL